MRGRWRRFVGAHLPDGTRGYFRPRVHTGPVQVEFTLYGTVRDAVGRKTLRRDLPQGTTVGEALHGIAEDHPEVAPLLFTEAGTLRSHVNVLVDGTNVRDRDGGETTLAEGSEVDVTPSVAGGRR